MRSRFLTVASVVVSGMLVAVSADAQQGQTQTQKQAPAQAQAQQTQTPATEVDKLPISLDRIREQLAREPVFSENLMRSLYLPVFRVEMRADAIYRPELKYKDNDVGSYVRPTVNRWDYDLQKMMNPNLPNGYGPGGGVDVLPSIQALWTGIRNGFRDRGAAATRRQIQEELRQINEQRKAAGLPPIEETPTVTPTSTTRQPDQP